MTKNFATQCLYAFALSFLAFTQIQTAHAVPGTRTRDLTSSEYDLVTDVILNVISPVDEDLANELLDRHKGEEIVALSGRTWPKLAGAVTLLPIFERVGVNPVFLNESRFMKFVSDRCVESPESHYCNMSAAMASQSPNSKIVHDLLSATLGSFLVHEHMHTRQARRGLHIRGTLSFLISPLTTRITKTNSFEVEAYQEQISFAMVLLSRAKSSFTRYQRIHKNNANTNRLTYLRKMIMGLRGIVDLGIKNAAQYR